MFLRRKMHDIGFSCEEVGLAVARADDNQQRQILLAMAAACEQMGPESWDFQCQAIVNGPKYEEGLSVGERSRIASMLSVLLNHMNQPSASA